LNSANLLSEKALVLSKAGRREETLACAEQCEEFLRPMETTGDNVSVMKFIRHKLTIAHGDEGNKDKKAAPRER
jgi:hypothetical protein